MSYNTKPKFETLKGKIKITPNFKGINCNLVLKKHVSINCQHSQPLICIYNTNFHEKWVDSRKMIGHDAKKPQ